MSDIKGNQTVIKLSVRSLVEFILRTGDIDDRHPGSVSEKAMQEGSRIHRLLQGRAGAGYSAEVPLSITIPAGLYDIYIEGRADGIIDDSLQGPASLMSKQLSLNQYLTSEEYSQITVDEIKCVRKKLSKMKAPVPVHLAQAKVYAYIYALDHKLPLIRVRMTYCDPRTEDLKYFFEEYTFEELREWFDGVIKEFRRFADMCIEWEQIRNKSALGLEFPFEYRKGQKKLVSYVRQTIAEGKKLYLEAPTGTGKTLITLFPSVKAFGAGLSGKVFYLTGKNVTGTVAENALSQMREAGLKIKGITLTAKDKICILPQRECNPEKCPYAKGHFDRINEAVFDTALHNDVMDRNVILEAAKKHKVCPFELSLDLSYFADVVIGDYNYLFDPHASLKRYFDGGAGDHIFLVDEAHNLIDRARDMYSAELILEELRDVKRTIDTALIKLEGKRRVKGLPAALKVSKALDKCCRSLTKLKNETNGGKGLPEEINEQAGFLESLNQGFAQFLDEEENTGLRKDVLEMYFKVSHFMYIYELLDKHYSIYTEIKEDDSFHLKLLCMDPSENLRECMRKGRSSILFSATFLPIQYYKKLTGGEDEDYEAYAESSFAPEHLGVFVDTDVTSRYIRRGDVMYGRIARKIYEAVSARNGNYMVFFTSHSFMQSVLDMYQSSYYDEDEQVLLIQKQHMTGPERDEFLAEFTADDAGAKRKRSLIGFCVLGGIFSEGIDLREEALIGSIIVGIGLPQVSFERELIKEYFEADGFDYAYRIPGMNKVLQAAGRVIRTENDTGIAVLMDERYTDNSYRRLFPREWKSLSIVSGDGLMQAVEDFWSLW